MSFVLTGSLGNISKPLAELLVKSGRKVIIISSTADRKKDIEALGAVAAIGSLEDSAFLSATFAGAEAVYAMVPPKYDEPDNNLYYKRIAGNYAKAIRSSGVKRVVLLSSYGADLPSGTGFINGIHFAENIFAEIDGVSFTFLRAGYFFTNFVNFFKGLIQHAGIIGSNYGGSDRLLLVHPADIAQAAAEELQAKAVNVGLKVRYVVSDIRTADEAAAILGPAINKPDLKWVTFPTADTIQGMIGGGMPPAAAATAAEMGDAIHTGILNAHYDSLPAAPLGPSKLEAYAVNEFAPAYFA